MQLTVMQGIRRLVPQEIPVRARFPQAAVAFLAPLSEREGDGAVGKTCFQLPKNVAEKLVGKMKILTALENEGAKAERVSLPGAGKDLLR